MGTTAGAPGTPLTQGQERGDGPDYGAPPILQVRNLKKYFPIKKGAIFAKHVGDVKAVEQHAFEFLEVRQRHRGQRLFGAL